MSQHDHEHAERQTKYGALNPEETANLKAEAQSEGATSVGFFLGKAANCETQSEREFWLGKVDSARYMEALQAARDKLDASARRNMEADERLIGTEASLETVRVIGNACVVKMTPGEKTPEGGYSLVRRVSGETGTEDYGPPYHGHWTVQSMRMDVVHEFSVVSSDAKTHKSVSGPWLAVPIGNVSTEAVQRAEMEEADRQYQERENAEAERQREHSAQVAQRRKSRQEALVEQQRKAEADNRRRELERIRREEVHKKAVEELHLVAPRDMSLRLRDLKAAGMVCDIEFKRGIKSPEIYQFKVDGTVLGYPPDGRYSGRKRTDHVYKRTVTVPRGRDVEIHVYGVTPHGDGGRPVTLPVPKSLCDDPEEESAEPASRMDQIIAAVKTFSGRRTRSGKPYVRDLRKHADMSDITTRERDQAHKLSKG